MILSRKWLNEFVDCSAWSDHDFSEAMTLSGSKVETFTDLHKNIQNVVAGRIVEMVRHTNSDHMWVCQVDVGGVVRVSKSGFVRNRFSYIGDF